MTRPLSRRSALILPLAAALPHRARAAGLTVTDAIGRTITLRAPAERIVLGFNLEEFTAVAGAEGWRRVVGFNRRQWETDRPPLWARMSRAVPPLASIADIGEIGEGSLEVETVLAQRPDLMVVTAYDYKASAAQLARIEAAGIPILVLDFQAQDTARNVAGTLALGAATGETARAQALADLYRDRMTGMTRRIAGSSWARASGAIRIGYDADLETARAHLRGYLSRPGWADLPAIRNGELHALDAGLACSLWDFTAMQYVAKAMHPDAFADIDPTAELRAFHERFLPIPFEGNWMVRMAPASA